MYCFPIQEEVLVNTFDDNEDERAKQILANLSLESEVIISIYGQTDQSVKRAEKQLRAIIDTRFVTEEIDNPGIMTLSCDNISDLEDFAKSHTVDIVIDRDPSLHFIRIHGCQSDVLMVKDKVRDVLADVVKVMRVNLLEGNYNNSNWFFVCPASVNLIFTFFH